MADHMTASGSDVRLSPVGVAVTPAPSPLRGDRRGRRLSRRELEALAAYARVGDQRQAAADLGVRAHTFKNHLTNTYAKLGVTNAIAAFHAIGWLRTPAEPSLEYYHHATLAAAAELRESLDRFADAIANARRETAAA